MIPYGYLTSIGQNSRGHCVEVAEERLHILLQSFLAEIEFDENWYVSENADVGAAIAAGHFGSGHQHYMTAGYFEDRLPRPVIVDEEWYLAQYPDVLGAVRSGSVASAQQHFLMNGFREGRLPSSGWSLRSNRSPNGK